jgi:hypothetical protein
MIQIYREVSDPVELNRRTLKMRFAAAPEPVHRNLVIAKRPPTRIEVPHLNLDRPRIGPRITKVPLNRNFIPTAHQMTPRDLDRFHRNQGKKHISAKAYGNKQNNNRALTHRRCQYDRGSPSTCSAIEFKTISCDTGAIFSSRHSRK